jgi:hypothetical protein
MRVLLISIATFIVIGVLILMARIWGQGQTFAEFPHEYFAGPAPLIVVKADSLDAVRAILAKKSDAAIWIDVRVSNDKVAFVLSPSRDEEFMVNRLKMQEANPQTRIYTGGRLSEYPWEQINEFYKTTPALKEYYQQFPQTRFVLNLVDNAMDVHVTVTDAIAELNPDKRTIIQSEANVVIDSVKTLKPAWLYGTSVPDLARMLTFDSLYVLPAIQFKGDVFIAPFRVSKRDAFNADIIAEMRRRHKRIILGPLKSAEEYAKAQTYSPDGYIFETLEQF